MSIAAAGVRELLEHAIKCRECGAPATNARHGELRTGSRMQSAEIILCDDCPPPIGGVFGRYSWFQPHDLEHAKPLRRLLLALKET